VHDYLDVGPEPGYGEIDSGQLDEWIAACKTVGTAALSPTAALSAGWMQIERAWNRTLDYGGPGEHVPEEAAKVIRKDLRGAAVFFDGISRPKDTITAAYGILGKTNLHLFNLVLTEKESSREAINISYSGHSQAAEAMLAENKRTQRLSDIWDLNALAGIAFTGLGYIYPTLGDHGDCYEVLLPSATRHWMGGGAVFGQWHGSIFDRDRKRTYRLRVAPDGPSDYLVLPPSVLLNTEYPARGPVTRGSLEAYLKLTIATSTFEGINSLPRTDPRLFEHTQKVNELVGAYIENNMARLRKYATSADSQNIDPEQAVEWYINLPHTRILHTVITAMRWSQLSRNSRFKIWNQDSRQMKNIF